jgi:hypothetical protein
MIRKALVVVLVPCVLALLPGIAHAARGNSGTSRFVSIGDPPAEPDAGTSSGLGERRDGAARAEAAEEAADRHAGLRPEDTVHPKSVQHQSTAQNPVAAQGPAEVPNPNVGQTPSENSPSSEPIGRFAKPASIEAAVARIEAAADRVESAANRAAQASERAEAAARRADEAFLATVRK